MKWPGTCVRPDEPLANHTSFRIGGPADWFAEPSTLDDLVAILREADEQGIPVSVVGGGTNTLAADRGVQGLVLHLGAGFRTIREVSRADEERVRVVCGAALPTQRLVSLAAKYGWGELEHLAGLPGQIGGAVTMNAQEIGQFVQGLRVVDFDGSVKDLSRKELNFRYRYAALEPGIITEAILEFPKVLAAEAYARIRQAFAYRNTTQELRLPSAGCAFKNPTGSSAGKLLDQAGLKGARIGDAQISLRHANFIVNVGQAKCDDVLALMEYAQSRVRRQFGVELEPEVRLIGERLAWTPWT
ncbi:MAG: UDP-N-acetylmuramate dehydrogenase [Candidatus Omnitrophica bacterium]|nr:UDP-N-acetylmuramate dehydrogenase [Candidatus Omnitrophota bacterium]MBI2174985.1 UDP-N-acetylmuramate dehydrogenase [Candidatus Omnitrophota bacterium]